MWAGQITIENNNEKSLSCGDEHTGSAAASAYWAETDNRTSNFLLSILTIGSRSPVRSAAYVIAVKSVDMPRRYRKCRYACGLLFAWLLQRKLKHGGKRGHRSLWLTNPRRLAVAPYQER